MVRTGLIAFMLLTAAWLAAGQTPAQQPAPETPEATADQPFRITTHLVQAPVTVIDKHSDSYVDGLQPQDFKLFDNGKEQNIHVDVTFQPISMVIAVQASDQVEGILPKINRIGSMIEPVLIGEQGEAAVMAFDHRFRTLQDFTSDPNKIEAAIKKITPGSRSSRLIDACTEAVRMLRSRPGNRRRILLVIAEVRDKGSEGKVRDALLDIQMNNVDVYSVDISRMMAGLTAPGPIPRPDNNPPAMTPLPNEPSTPTTVWQATGGQGNSVQFVPMLVEIFKDTKAIFVDNPVEVFARGSGGSQFSFAKQKGLEDAIQSIGREIHSQYIITYTPNNLQEGGFHEIQVDVNRRDVKVRTRPGYWMASLQK
ncbi:MAG TPA: VWA domain-containing protein [Bryobacteraceae bacterium]|nr:VWA domain-containing protein [Bryobacteraceae bacterium]